MTLIECDALSTEFHNIHDFRIVGVKELSSSQVSIDGCRMDMLYRQRQLAKALGESDDVVDSICFAINQLNIPNYEPIKYTARKRHKFIGRLLAFLSPIANLIGTVIFLGIILSLFFS